ncbi:MAG: hypothetical protein OXH49_05685 [Gemmatimonadetes bacterium]|nr:hypothetical protein [Gemmatimonadota bacterium]
MTSRRISTPSPPPPPLAARHRRSSAAARPPAPSLLVAATLALASCSVSSGATADGAPPPGAAAATSPRPAAPAAAAPVADPTPPERFAPPPGVEARREAWYDGRDWAARTLETLTLEEKVGQMMMPFIFGDFAPRGSSAATRARAMVEDHKVGGVIVSVGSPTEVAAKLNWLQSLSSVPLLIGSDLEAGAGFRFDGIIHVPTNIPLGGATRFPALMAVGATGDPGFAYEMGRVTAREALAIGVHVPFAPVLDVNNNPENPVINVRSFGEDPERVATLGAAFVRGIQEQGAIATAKHFPGHGDTGVDSHIALPVIQVGRERMDAVELKPFRRAIGSDLGAIMTAHITVPELTGDRMPATLAPAVMTDLLRGEMGFDGLIITDAMDMAAVDRAFGRGEATVRAIEAGADVILMPPDLGAARSGLMAAVRSGRVSEERIDRSVLRILNAKARVGLHRWRQVDLGRVAEFVGVEPHTAVAQAVAERSITVLKDERDLLPLLGTRTARVYSVTYRRTNDIRAGRAFNAGLRQTYQRLGTAYVDQNSDAADYEAILARARGSALTILSLHVGVRTASGSVALPEPAMDFVKALARSSRPSIVVAFGNPYLLSEFPEVGTYLTAWSGVPVAERAAADAILGRIAVTGRTPTRIAGFDVGHGLQIPRKEASGN